MATLLPSSRAYHLNKSHAFPGFLLPELGTLAIPDPRDPLPGGSKEESMEELQKRFCGLETTVALQPFEAAYGFRSPPEVE